jgi:biopolymer transport protein ExbB
MQFSWTEIWQHMGAPAIAVASALLLMGMASLTVFVERLFTLRRSRAASRLFSKKVAEAVGAGRFDAAIAEAEKHKHSHLARIFRAALVTYRHADRNVDASAITPFDHTQRFLERYLEEISSDLRRGLGLLASVGSTAPFVGLLGTVLGIISAFQGIASAGSGGLAAVSAGISEALIETALGLVVAIPAVLAFNYLSTKIGHEEMTLRNAAGHLLDTIEDYAERAALARRGSPSGNPKPIRDRVALSATAAVSAST